MLGVSDAPNAASALVASRTAGYGAAVTFSFVFTAAGALLGGTAVAVTINSLIDVPPDDRAAAYAAACLSAMLFVGYATWRSLPTSATFGLIGGLIGAAVVAGGLGAVNWVGTGGSHVSGAVGALTGLVLSPVLGIGLAWLVRRVATRVLARATRRALGPIRGGIWLGAAAVAISDGTNDGQKAMGLIAGVLIATGRLTGFSIPFWSRAAVAVTLALGTAIGGRRIVRRVARGYYRGVVIDGLGAQLSAAAVIFGCSAVGAPISTSTVVASSFVGVGIDRRPRHVRWRAFAGTVGAWILTVPVCIGLGALLFLGMRLIP